MVEVDKGRLFLKLVILGILVYLLTLSLGGNFRAPVAAAQAPAVTVEAQPGAPVSVSSVTISSADPREPVFTYLVSNTSQKPISAYVVRYVVVAGAAPGEDVELRFGDAPDTVLHAGASEWAEYAGHASSEPVRSIRLVVDFVEFTDGTTWGQDKHKSSERLSGHRAGVRAETDRLLEIRKTKGVGGVLNAIAAEGERVPFPPGHSPLWLEGFREGVTAVHGRLKRAHGRGGEAEVEEELGRKFDSPGRPVN